MDIQKIATQIIKKAGKELLKEYNDYDRAESKLKSNREIVTRADLLAEEIIIKEIKKNFPAHAILSEETGGVRGQSDYLWVVDPIDGTTNFSMHNPIWSISIAVTKGDKIILGLVYAPVTNELFSASVGKGAELNGKKINVSKIADGKILHAFCHGTSDKDVKRAIKYYNKQKGKGFDCRQMGSAAIEMAYVACGRIESITIPGTRCWDVAAGCLLVREAGGRVTDFSGREWELDCSDIVASNGRVHEGILEIVRPGRRSRLDKI